VAGLPVLDGMRVLQRSRRQRSRAVAQTRCSFQYWNKRIRNIDGRESPLALERAGPRSPINGTAAAHGIATAGTEAINGECVDRAPSGRPIPQAK